MHLYVSFFGITVFVKSIRNTVEVQKLEGLETIPLSKMWGHRFFQGGLVRPHPQCHRQGVHLSFVHFFVTEGQATVRRDQKVFI